MGNLFLPLELPGKWAKGKPRSFSPTDVMSEEGTPLGPTSLDVYVLFF